VDLATLRAARPDLLEKAAADWKSAAGRLGQISSQFREQIDPLFIFSWAGLGADAASQSLTSLSAQLTAVTADMNAMASLYQDAAMGVSAAQALLRVAEDHAAANGLEIGPGGAVSVAVPAGAGLLARALEQEAAFAGLPPAAAGVASLVAKALRLAGEVDSQVSAQLAGLPGTASAVAAADALARKLGSEMMPPAGMSPKEINEWWAALDAAAQQQLIHEFPARIGWMNGLPATARDQANRLAMNEEEKHLRSELARLLPHPPAEFISDGLKVGEVPNPAFEQWQAQISQIQNELWGIGALERSLALGGKGGLPHAYLLGFGVSGRGQAIIAYGNPDTAATTVTFVPGTGASLNESGADASHAAVLWQQAHKLNPGQSLSSIYWLNYDAPNISSLSGYLSMASPASAVAGGHALAAFQSGLAAAHSAAVPDRTVLLGHSYGSLVIGEAAAHDGVHPSDIIVVGSPGLGVSKAAQLGIPASHVWAGANINDPVPDIPPDAVDLLPKVGADAVLGGIGGLLTHGLSGIMPGAEAGAMDTLLIAHLQNPDASYFGTNPATPAFGGNDFAADYVPGRPSSFDMSYFDSFRAHTTYWSQGSASLRNMAAIVAGKYGQVTMAGSGAW
jgi:Alpha/beta hydrolase